VCAGLDLVLRSVSQSTGRCIAQTHMPASGRYASRPVAFWAPAGNPRLWHGLGVLGTGGKATTVCSGRSSMCVPLCQVEWRVCATARTPLEVRSAERRAVWAPGPTRAGVPSNRGTTEPEAAKRPAALTEVEQKASGGTNGERAGTGGSNGQDLRRLSRDWLLRGR